VNAIVGKEVTVSGRQRPTTRTPILLVHPQTDPEALGLDLTQFTVKSVDAAVLRDIVIIDCPDPDTSEQATADSNLELLRQIVPHCDVLLYTSTQQKYRSARVTEELVGASEGCRLVFVQTHADTDVDIRDDWKTQLKSGYEVPDMFFVDSVRAFKEQQAGHQPTGDFQRLQRFLTSQLGASKRVEIRRSNLIDLLEGALVRSRADYDQSLPAVRQLIEVLQQQKKQLLEVLTRQLTDELLQNRNLWERRLLSEVTDRWGFSPFSALLRFYNGLGAFIASFTFFRARTSAQMALIGAVQGARWLKARTQEQDAESSLERLSTFGLSDQQLQESRVAVSGYLRSAAIDREEDQDRRDLTHLRHRAASLEGEFLGDARRVIDRLIQELAAKNCGWLTRCWYEVLFLVYVVLMIGRVGYNFFWSSFLGPIMGRTEAAEELLTVDFYVPATLFLVIWSVLLVAMFTSKLRRGLRQRVISFAEDMAGSQLAHGLFPSLEQTTDAVLNDSDEVDSLLNQTQSLRSRLAISGSGLGRLKTEQGSEDR
jgi:hypothetical protein